MLHRGGEQVIVVARHHRGADGTPLRGAPSGRLGGAGAGAQDEERVAIFPDQLDAGLAGRLGTGGHNVLLVAGVLGVDAVARIGGDVHRLPALGAGDRHAHTASSSRTAVGTPASTLRWRRTAAAKTIMLNVRGHCAAKKSANACTVIERSASSISSRDRLTARYWVAHWVCWSRVIRSSHGVG